MHRVILAHVPEDEAAAQYWARLSGGISVCVRDAKSAVHAGAGALLGVVWSRVTAASPAADRLMQIAGEAPIAVLFQFDESALPEGLAALKLVSVAADAQAKEVEATLRLAQRMQPRRPLAQPHRAAATPQFARPTAAEELKAPSYGRMFVSGMTRGLASSVAVISLGAGAAVGVQGKGPVLGIGDSVANTLDAHIATAGLTDDREATGHELLGIVSDAELAQQANNLRHAAAAQRAQISEKLILAQEQIADARVRTDSMIARLSAISSANDHWNVASAAPVAAPSVLSAAPEAPQLAAVTVHAEPVAAPEPVAQAQADASDVYAITRYADRINAPLPQLTDEESTRLSLWSPI
ncbi:MAG: hypothetical protein ABUS57_11235 [Pseudomonadota bacterium]